MVRMQAGNYTIANVAATLLVIHMADLFVFCWGGVGGGGGMVDGRVRQ